MVTSQLLVMSALMLGATPRGVVYEFTASWCGPCQQMSPMVSRLERQGYPIKKVDVDQNREFAGKYRITSIPAFVLVVDGKEVQRVVGATSEQNLKRMFARIPKAAAKEKPETLLASERSAAPAARQSRQGGLVSRKKKPRFQIPFLGSADDEPEADISEATVRANIDDAATEPVPPTLATPMEASVRIRANSGSGINYGSGTIISSEDGRTLVLTCGHICRGMGKSGKMEVDVFYGKTSKTYVGKVLRYFEKADVGLLEIPTDETYPHSPVVPLGYVVQKGEAVASVGCGGGENPTQQQHRVISLNRYLGPDHIECSGEPIEGRSGGGLFNTAGEVIGVCFARDPQDHRGLYAGVKPIHELLKQCGLQHLYQVPANESVEDESELLLVNEEVEVDLQNDVADEVSMEDEIYTDAELNEAVAANVSVSDTQIPAGSDLEALKEAISQVGESEVVCVVRPIKNPRGASRVVILNRASDQFVRFLTDELESDPLNHTTSLKIPAAPKKTVKNTTHRSAPAPERAIAHSDSQKTGPRRYRRKRR